MTEYVRNTLTGDLAPVNSELTKIKTALDSKIDRKPVIGQANQMEEELDMNGYEIINYPANLTKDSALVRRDQVAGLSSVTSVNGKFGDVTIPVFEGDIGGITSFATTAEIEATTPTDTGARIENRERANAQYELAATGYTALPGDIVAANGRIWELVTTDKVDYYGASGDDSTINNQAFLDAMSRSSTLVIPEGVYQLSFWHINKSLTISGSGTIKQVPLSNANFIEVVSSGVEVRFKGITIDQNNSQQTLGSGKFLFNATAADARVEFNGVTFKDFCEGALRMVGDRDEQTRETLTIRDCKFRGGTESESGVYDTFTIFCADAAELIVDSCDFDHGLPLTKQGIPAISVAGTSVPSAEYTKVKIINNTFIGYGRYTSGTGIGAIDCYVWATDAIISGNTFTGSRVTPIRGKVNANRVVISNNIMSGFVDSGLPSANSGISIVSATLGPVSGKYVVSDNIIESPTYRGIEISEASGVVDEIRVSGNIISDSGDIGVYLVRCSNFHITENVVSNSGQQGIAFSTCEGSGHVKGNTVNVAALTGIQALGLQTSLNVSIKDNTLTEPTASGITVENVGTLSMEGNVVKDVVNSGSQRGYRVGGSSGTLFASIKDNLAIGAFATADYQVISPGFENLFESGNSWNKGESSGIVAPTSGTWARGSKVWNTLPVASGNMGWVCVTAGTPGTWKEFGTIEA